MKCSCPRIIEVIGAGDGIRTRTLQILSLLPAAELGYAGITTKTLKKSAVTIPNRMHVLYHKGFAASVLFMAGGVGFEPTRHC